MAIGVNAAVKAVEPTVAHPFEDSSVTQACFRELSTSQDSPLPPRNLPQAGLGVFPFHFARESAQPGKFAAWIASFTAAVAQALHKRG